MKKFKIWYWIIFLIALVMAITKGFDIGIVINSNHGGEAFEETSILLINFVIVLSILIFTLIITINKNNKIKFKWAVFIGIVFLSLFIPVATIYSGDGITSEYIKNYTGIFTFIRSLITLL